MTFVYGLIQFCFGFIVSYWFSFLSDNNQIRELKANLKQTTAERDEAVALVNDFRQALLRSASERKHDE